MTKLTKNIQLIALFSVIKISAIIIISLQSAVHPMRYFLKKCAFINNYYKILKAILLFSIVLSHWVKTTAQTDSLLKIIKTTKTDTTHVQLAKGSWQLAN